MTAAKDRHYIITSAGKYFVQIENKKARAGFYLCNENQSWDGGIGVATDWTFVAAEKVPAPVRERLEFLMGDDCDI